MSMPNLAWGGFSNGAIPLGNLVQVQPDKFLQADAARTWRLFAAEFQRVWGARLYLDDYQDAYRDLGTQQYMWDHRKDGYPHPAKVAYPGNSIHGWARSVDCTGYGARGSLRHNWLVANAPRFGWSWTYASEMSPPEGWHFDYVGPITTTAGGGDVIVIPPVVIEVEEDKDAPMQLTKSEQFPDKFYAYGEITFRSEGGMTYDEAKPYSQVFGKSNLVPHSSLAKLKADTLENRQALITDIATAVAVASNVDPQAVADAVAAQFAGQFEAIRQEIAELEANPADQALVAQIVQETLVAGLEDALKRDSEATLKTLREVLPQDFLTALRETLPPAIPEA